MSYEGLREHCERDPRVLTAITEPRPLEHASLLYGFLQRRGPLSTVQTCHP